MFGIVPRLTRNGNHPRDGMDKVPMTPLPTPIYEAVPFKISDELAYFSGHCIISITMILISKNLMNR
ncbi:hypothetical protein BH11VER1_BH11VER1_28300 [soil metagenome]